MGGKELTEEEKKQKEQKLKEQEEENTKIFKKLYERITSDPLYNETILKQYTRYDSPKTIMEKVEDGRMDLSKGINELQQWVKVFLIIADKTKKQRLHDILEKNKDIIDKNTKDLDTEMNIRGLKF